jgi:ATP-dependent RNA helicase RhlE
MNRLLPMQRGATRVLVLAPTRELAAQIAEHFQQLAVGTKLTCAAVFGGVAMGGQERAFRKGVDVIVACPGRLLDHMHNSYADFSSLKFLVVDEADRMFDMGFLPDIKRVLAALPKDRQTLLFSATLPREIVELSRSVLRNPERINIDRAPAAAEGVSHAVYPVSSDRKSNLLLELLNHNIKGSSTLVFTRTKHRANRLADFLDKNGVPCARIHGNRSQSQRTLALAGFKKGSFQVLVATDIAARGIDVEALGYVVNFDVPHQPEDYIHRVGRTARAQLTGEALTLVAPEEEQDFTAIERTLGKRLPRQKLSGFDYTSKPKAVDALNVRPPRPPRSDGRSQGRQRERPQGDNRQPARSNADNGPRERSQGRPSHAPADNRSRERSHGQPASSGAQYGHSSANNQPPGYVPLTQHAHSAGANKPRNARRTSRW